MNGYTAAATLSGLVFVSLLGACSAPPKGDDARKADQTDAAADDLRAPDRGPAEAGPKSPGRSDAAKVGTPADGLIRPGGPVNEPVPGLNDQPGWPELTAGDLVGDWQVTLPGGLSACLLGLGEVNAAGSGALTLTGACPLGEPAPVRWRYFGELGQIALLDSTGRAVLRAHRRGEMRFSLYTAQVGTMTLLPAS